VSVDAKSASARTAEVGGLRVTDATYRAQFVSPPHAHERHCVTVLLHGDMAKGDSVLSHGAIALTPAATEHVDRFGATGGRVVVVEHDLPLRSTAARLPWLGHRLAAELSATDAAAPLALHAAALELLACVARAPARSGVWLDEVTDELHDRLFERITIQELAHTAGVHRTHLARAFKARHGVSIGEYVRRERVRHAAQQLRTTHTPIAVIALQAGFADQSHFTRVFVRHFGESPGRYRRERGLR
jgi:AraC family transcriptional regulator